MLNSANDLVSRVMLHLKGCPENMAGESLRVAFSRLCRETGCWRSSFTFLASAPVEAKDGWAETKVPELAVDAEICRVRDVFVERAVEGGTFGTPYRLQSGTCALSMMADVILRTAKSVVIADGDRITMDLELSPSAMGHKLDDVPLSVARFCGNAAVLLAASLTASMPGRPWTDLNAAAMLMLDATNERRRINQSLGVGYTADPSSSRLDIVEG